MNKRFLRMTRAVRIATATGAAVALLATQSALAVIGDFNGDGVGDLAVGIPSEDLLVASVNRVDAGAVNVIYGTANNGLRGAQTNTPTSQLWHQGSDGIADSIEAGDRFGEAVAAGDFNNDGFADLAVTVRGDNAVHIINGSATGLTATGSRMLLASQLDDLNGFALSIGGSATSGSTLVSGDFNGDNIADLVVEGREFTSGIPELSKIAVLYGSQTAGLSLGGIDLFAFDNNVAAVEGADIGAVKVALAAGDVDNDGDDDLAVGLPFSNLNSGTAVPGIDAGRVGILLGTPASGLSTVGFRTLTQATGTGESVEALNQFGAALAMGDFDADGRADLAVGVPRDDRGVVVDEGSVRVFRSAETFQSLWTESILAQPRDVADIMGSSLAAADFNGDGFGDLAIGTPGDFVDASTGDTAGSVTVLHGGMAGLSTANGPGARQFVQGNTLGTSRSNERFGAALSAGNVGRSTHADLVVGSPGETITTTTTVARSSTRAVSADGDGIDHRLHAADEARLTEYEQELVAAIGSKLARIHVLQQVHAVLCQQRDVHGEGLRCVFVGNRFDGPGIRANRDNAQVCQVLGAFNAEARLASHECGVVFANQVLPAGMEQHHVALADLDALRLGNCVDLGAIEHLACGQRVHAEVLCHVEQHAPRHNRWDCMRAQLQQASRRYEVGSFVAVVVDVLFTHVAQTVELAANADIGTQEVIVAGRVVAAHRNRSSADDDKAVPARWVCG